MNKKLLTPRWLIAAAVCVLLCTLLVGGSVWAQTATTPAAPAIESLTPSDQAITVVWTAPASNGGSDITSYDLRHIGSDAADKSDDNWTVEDNVWSSGALQATITGLTNGASYDVQARAVNAIGNGPWSATVSGRAATVPRQAGLRASYQDGGISLIYTSRGDDGDGGSPITSFDARYIRADAPDLSDNNWTVLLGISTRGSRYVIEGLTNGVTYHVQVRAVNDVGNGAWSERDTETPLGPPDPPAIGTVTGSDGALAITWSAPGDDGGAAVTGYNLRYIRHDSSDFAASRWTYENGIWTSGDLEYTLSGLDNNVRYRLGLQAVNSEGSGGWSDANDPRTGTPGDPPGSTRRANEYQGVFDRNDGGHQLVRPGRRRRGRHHQLRPSLHRQRRDGQGRRQLDSPEQRVDLRRAEVCADWSDGRRPVRLPNAGGQLRRRGTLVRHRQQHGIHRSRRSGHRAE